NTAGNNIAGTRLGSSNLAGIDSGANIHGLTGVMGMLYSGEDMWKPDGTNRSQCIVMGMGSTAFAKLVGQQSANAKMYVALGKLPWGFSTLSAGPVALNAWEAVVWGDKTYCTFLLMAQPTTPWSGAAGYIKAIFRWNAPPTQQMEIGGIDESAIFDPTYNAASTTYTGMMDGAAKQKGGTLSPANFVDRDRAAAAATTKNHPPSVDSP